MQEQPQQHSPAHVTVDLDRWKLKGCRGEIEFKTERAIRLLKLLLENYRQTPQRGFRPVGLAVTNFHVGLQDVYNAKWELNKALKLVCGHITIKDGRKRCGSEFILGYKLVIEESITIEIIADGKASIWTAKGRLG